MPAERKTYARYPWIRGHQSFWNGDAVEAGSKFRTIVITSDEIGPFGGTNQVYALEGVGKGIEGGKFAGVDDVELLSDQDIPDLKAAGAKFKELVADAEANGFTPITFWEIAEFEAKARESQHS